MTERTAQLTMVLQLVTIALLAVLVWQLNGVASTLDDISGSANQLCHAARPSTALSWSCGGDTLYR